MKNFACFGRKLQHLCSCSCFKLVCLSKYSQSLIACLYRYVLFRVHPFWIQLCYFISMSIVGFFLLSVINPRPYSIRPKNFDLFFTSVSAVTVSSMSSVEMEVFSNTQLVIIMFLMLFGGEVSTSMVGLLFEKSKLKKHNGMSIDVIPTNDVKHIEMGIVSSPNFHDQKSSFEDSMVGEAYLKYNSIRYLGYIVIGYLLIVLLGGSSMVMIYLSLVSSASNVLKNKGLDLRTFSFFTIISTFTNCGFVPTNENMIVFKSNPGLLLILIPQVLLGNTLFPSCLRLVIWVLRKMMKRNEFNYMLENPKEIGYLHLLPSLHSLCLVVSVVGFIVLQFVVFCCMEWKSEALEGMSSYQKVVGALFMTVSARHSGESIVDLSMIAPAVLVLFVLMMYLPPYTSFLPIKEDEESSKSCEKTDKKQRGQLVENLVFSQLSYLVMFVVLICITERKKMKDDPLNFSVLNVVIEVVSAYGNVGFTTGYSCKRRLNLESYCKDAWYGFSGRWSDKGKMILILVMFFGRLKKFNMKGGKAWKIM